MDNVVEDITYHIDFIAVCWTHLNFLTQLTLGKIIFQSLRTSKYKSS